MNKPRLIKIKLQIVDDTNGQLLEDLGTCLCDSVSKAVNIYDDELLKWIDQGYEADIHYQMID